MRTSIHIAIFSLLLVCCIGTAHAGKRVALVIGNSAYEHVSILNNPTNDADDIAAVLQKIGFDVTKVKNLDYRKMRIALRQFSQKAIGTEIALVYYAGHGIEVNRQNYLIPTDAKLQNDIDVEFESMPLDSIVHAVSGAKNLGLILLDACRDNPFARSMKRTVSTRSVGRGLARVEPTVGTLVSYAAKEGTVVSDGSERNSPYTQALIKHIGEPGIDIQFVFRKVRDSVLASTKGKQEPFTYGSLPGKRIILKPAETKPTSDTTVEFAYWNSIKNKQETEYFQAYVKRYPSGLFLDVALLEIERLKSKPPQANEPLSSMVSKDTEKPSEPRKNVDSNDLSLPSMRGRKFMAQDVPFACDECLRKIKRKFVRAKLHKAIAISTSGAVGWTTRYKKKSRQLAVKVALKRCNNRSAHKCEVYAINGEVVWDHPKPILPPKPWVASNAKSVPFDVSRLKPLSKAHQNRIRREYLKAKNPKALAVGPDGAWAYFKGAASQTEAMRIALQMCAHNQGGKACRIAAVNGKLFLD